MSRDPFTSRTARRSRRQREPGEVLFEFSRGFDRYVCELRDHGAIGVEAQFLLNGDLSTSPVVRHSGARRAMPLHHVKEMLGHADIS